MEQVYQAAFRAGLDPTIITDTDGLIHQVNPALIAAMTREASDLTGTSIFDLFTDESSEQIRPAIVDGQSWQGEVSALRHDGMSFPAEATVIPVHGEDGISAFIVIIRDISERQTLERRAQHHALHDTVTGLPNRILLMDRTQTALLRLRRSRLAVAVLYLDLDRFSRINDTYGHAGGDWLLSVVARRIQQYLRISDTASRIGGDEFVIVLEALYAEDEAIGIARRLLHAFDNPFTVQGHDITISTCVGIALTTDSEVPPEALLHAAHQAVHDAKRSGAGGASKPQWIGGDSRVGEAGKTDELLLRGDQPSDDGDIV